jgi:branched-chain amino acid transport system substrate-binding protein
MQAGNLRDFAPPLLLPGIKLSTSPEDYFLFETLELVRFDGTTWVPLT